MKKIVLAISTMAAFSLAHAGSMGPVSTSAYTPYLTGEASYTWPQINNAIINNSPFTASNQGWGGRLGGGMMYDYSEKLSFTGEIGGGYYGSRNQNTYGTTGRLASMGSSIDGYDVLAGFVYKWNYFDVFLQGGFMMENLRLTYNGENSTLVGTGSAMNLSGVQSQTLPEIKVGGIYRYNPNWGISVAYMHVFGNTYSAVQDGSLTTLPPNMNISATLQNPTLDSIMFGLHYNFVM